MRILGVILIIIGGWIFYVGAIQGKSPIAIGQKVLKGKSA